MSIHPVDHAHIVDREHFANTAEAIPLQVEAHCQLSGGLVIAHRFAIGSEVATAHLASWHRSLCEPVWLKPALTT